MRVLFPGFLSVQFPSEHLVDPLRLHPHDLPSGIPSSSQWLTLTVTFPSERPPWTIALNNSSDNTHDSGNNDHVTGSNHLDSGSNHHDHGSDSESDQNLEQRLDLQVTFPDLQSLDYLSRLVVSHSVSRHLLALLAMWLRREPQKACRRPQLLHDLMMTDSGRMGGSHPRLLLRRRHRVVLHFGMEEFASQVDLAG